MSWNRAVEKLTGIPAGQAIGRRCYEVISGMDDAGRRVCRENCVVSQRAKRGRPRSCPPLLIATKRGAKAMTISTLIVREGTEPLVVHIARERRS